jgi:chorismate-pyruvate lyase
MSVDRRTFSSTGQERLLRVLLAQDGSTTRICEALAGRRVDLITHVQRPTEDVPERVRSELGGSRWLERVTSLCIDGVVMMDNLSFTRLDAVPDWFLQELERGVAPVGHLLDRIFVRRVPMEQDADLTARLWDVVGMPDPAASRAYRIVTPDAPLMAIFEVYRAGMATVSPAVAEQG